MKRILILLALTVTLTGCIRITNMAVVGPSMPTVIKSETWLLGNPPSYEKINSRGVCQRADCLYRLQGNRNYRVLVYGGSPETTVTSNFVTLTPEGSSAGVVSWRYHIIGEKDGPYWIKLSSGDSVQILNISVF